MTELMVAAAIEVIVMIALAAYVFDWAHDAGFRHGYGDGMNG